MARCWPGRAAAGVMSATASTSGWCLNWHGEDRCSFPLSRSPPRWTPIPSPGWSRRCAGLRARCAARRAISGAATWRFPSISLLLIRSAEADRYRDPRTARRRIPRCSRRPRRALLDRRAAGPPLRRGCHIHAVPATWLGHPRLMPPVRPGGGLVSPVTAACPERSSTGEPSPGCMNRSPELCRSAAGWLALRRSPVVAMGVLVAKDGSA